ncbi:HU family DNA-binding protein [bacterium]|nr:HU family DNA-binding protein [bacterium]
MTKAGIINLVAEKCGFSARDVRLVVEEFIVEVKDCLKSGKHLEIRGFGTFRVRERKSRRARNPKTEESILIPARRVAVFKGSPRLDLLIEPDQPG